MMGFGEPAGVPPGFNSREHRRCAVTPLGELKVEESLHTQGRGITVRPTDLNVVTPPTDSGHRSRTRIGRGTSRSVGNCRKIMTT